MIGVLKFDGPHGPYDVSQPQGKDLPIEVVHGDRTLRWVVQVMDGPMGPASGLTNGTALIWGDVYWFEFTPGPTARIDYYGSGVLVRTDYEATS